MEPPAATTDARGERRGDKYGAPTDSTISATIGYGGAFRRSWWSAAHAIRPDATGGKRGRFASRGGVLLDSTTAPATSYGYLACVPPGATIRSMSRGNNLRGGFPFEILLLGVTLIFFLGFFYYVWAA
jgi:hypothetical protein